MTLEKLLEQIRDLDYALDYSVFIDLDKQISSCDYEGNEVVTVYVSEIDRTVYIRNY